MQIDHPSARHIPGLRQLWQEAFGDEDFFLNAFFDHGFCPSRSRCVLENDTPIAALYWFDCDLQDQKVAYLYALATAKSHRGKGLCHSLMADTHRLLEKNGYAGAVLVPGTEDLFTLYSTMGYTTVNCAETVGCAAGEPIPVRKIDTTEFFRLRSTYLPPNAIIMGQKSCRFLSEIWSLYAGNRWILAAFDKGSDFIGMEFLGDTAALPGILAALGKESGSFRIPGKQAFAMYKTLGSSLMPDYFGLPFD